EGYKAPSRTRIAVDFPDQVLARIDDVESVSPKRYAEWIRGPNGCRKPWNGLFTEVAEIRHQLDDQFIAGSVRKLLKPQRPLIGGSDRKALRRVLRECTQANRQHRAQEGRRRVGVWQFGSGHRSIHRSIARSDNHVQSA